MSADPIPSPTTTSPVSGEVTVAAPEIANELWEILFGETKDNVPEALTDELLLKVAQALLTGYEITRRAA